MHEVDGGAAVSRMSTALIILASSSDHFMIMLGALLIIFTAYLQTTTVTGQRTCHRLQAGPAI